MLAERNAMKREFHLVYPVILSTNSNKHFLEKIRIWVSNIMIHHPEVGEAAKQHKDMKNFVKTKYTWPGIGSFQSINHRTNRVKHAAN